MLVVHSLMLMINAIATGAYFVVDNDKCYYIVMGCWPGA